MSNTEKKEEKKEEKSKFAVVYRPDIMGTIQGSVPTIDRLPMPNKPEESTTQCDDEK